MSSSTSTSDIHLKLASQHSGFKYSAADGFQPYKVRIRGILKVYGFLDAITQQVVQAPASSRASFGPSSNSSSSSSSSSISSSDETIKRSDTVFTFIMLTLLPEQLKLVQHVNEGDAHGLWSVLLEHYERKTLASKLSLRQQFTNIKMEANESFDSYLSRFKRLVLRLGEEGETIGETTTLATLLNGLPEEYERVIDTLTIIDDITFERACSFIKDKQDKMLLKKSTSATSATLAASAAALLASDKAPNNRNRGPRGRGGGNSGNSSGSNRPNNGSGGRERPCFSCNERGHDGVDCPLNKDKIKCTTCRWVGSHTADNCKYLPNPKASSSSNSSAQPNKALIAADPHNEYDDHCFMANESDCSITSARPDSGSSESNISSSSSSAIDGSSIGSTLSISSSSNSSALNISSSSSSAIDGSSIGSALSISSSSNSSALNIGSALKGSSSHTNLIFDTGASRHLINDRSLLINIRPIPSVPVSTAGGVTLHIHEVGDLVLIDRKQRITLKDVGYIAALEANLISGSKITNAGYTIDINDSGATIKKNNKSILSFAKIGGLFIYCYAKPSATTAYVGADMEAIRELNKQHLLHCRMGHNSMSALHQLISNEMVDDIDNVHIDASSEHVCAGCIAGKAHRKPFGAGKFDQAKEIMDCLHVDLCGPIFGANNKENSINAVENGDQNFLIAVDEYSRKVWGGSLKNKSDACEHLIALINRLETESGKKLKQLHTDGGTEFETTRFIKYCKTKGIAFTTTTPYTPEQNPIAERAIRTIFESMRSTLHHAKLTSKFWPQVAKAACYIRNRCYTSSIKSKRTPEHIWSGRKPSIKHIRVIGCNAFVHVRKVERGKLDNKTTPAIHLGWNEQQNSYLVFDIELNKFVTSCHVEFDEESFSHSKQYNERINDASESYGDIGSHDELFNNEIALAKLISLEPHNQAQPQPQPQQQPPILAPQTPPIEASEPAAPSIKQPKAKMNWKKDASISELNPDNVISAPRVRTTTKQLGLVNYKSDIGSEQAFSAFITPNTFEQAMQSAQRLNWRTAMDKEMQSLHDNNVWELVNMPTDKNVNIMGCRWIYKVKETSEGEIERLKARLVGQGFTQVFGKDYNETWAPVPRYKSVRIIIAIACIKGYELKQLDIETAFLYADVKEDIYMRQPKGYEKGGANMVCKLKKALYGIKQAPHEWNNEINTFMVDVLQFTRCKSDTCVYVKRCKSGNIMIISIFVDDIIIAHHTSDSDEWLSYKQLIVSKYKIRDLGNLEWILGMKVRRNRSARTLTIDHERYIKNMLINFGMEECNTAPTPESSERLTAFASSRDTDLTEYQTYVGALQYTASALRVDIAHAVNMLSRYLQAPKEEHLTAAKRVLRYLKGTATLGLNYSSSSSSSNDSSNNGGVITSAYCDADWAGDHADRKSQTGLLVKVGGNTVIWASRKQTTTSLSTCEAEYIAISSVVQEVIWTNSLLKELSFAQTNPTQIHCDNTAAIHLSNNDTSHSQTKHIDIRHHYIRDEVKNKNIIITYLESAKQQADIFTKGLSQQVFIPLRDQVMFIQSNQSVKEEC
jgi:transposase InsO family protein